MIKRLFASEKFLVAAGYVVFLLFFFIIGVTKAQFASFVAIVLLTGIYYLIVELVKRILED
jgi:hypothetical protein